VKCSTPNCRKKRQKHRTLCPSCKQKRYSENNPIQYAYQNLRGNAKKRRKEFNLTFEEFKKWAIETHYMFGKGRQKHSFHVDRIREWEGYHVDNLQVLSNSKNKKKHLQYVRDEKGKPENFTFESTESSLDHQPDDCPF